MNTNNNFLVLWNPLNNSEENTLKQFLNKLLNQNDSGKLIKWKIVFSEGQLETELSESNLSHIIVLCELTWLGKKFSDFYGIELVQLQIRVNHGYRKAINLPILFVSFCTREQIVKMDQTKEIINTYGLGNHFIQLPKASETEISDLWKMKPATELEMIDTLHFCAYEQMIASIRHGIASTDLNLLRSKLQIILEKLYVDDDWDYFGQEYNTKYSDLEYELSKCESKENFVQICDKLQLKVSNSKINKHPEYVIDFNVLLIDDEETEDIQDFIREAVDFGIEIIHVSTTEKAMRIIEEDYGNKFSVIISDYRIWDNPTDNYNRRLLYPQGYSFIEQSIKYGRIYKYAAFSELPREFRMKVLSKLNIRIEPINKTLMISTRDLRLELVEKIIDLAHENLSQLSSLACDKTYFRTLYYRFLTEKNIVKEEYIVNESRILIDKFNTLFDENFSLFFEEKFSEKNLFAIEWNLIKSNFNLQATYGPVSEEAFYKDEFDKLVKVIIRNKKYTENEIKNFINSNNDLRDLNIFWCFNNKAKEEVPGIIAKKVSYSNSKAISEEIFNYFKSEKETFNSLKNNKPYEAIDSKDPYTPDAMEKFIMTLICRRWAIFLYYKIGQKLEENQYLTIQMKKEKETDLTKKVLVESPLSKQITTAVSRVLVNGNLNYSSKNYVTSKGLFLSKKGGRDISELKDIALSYEEQNFFRINYPDLYEKWNN